MVSSPKAPPAPDPVATAAAQSGVNRDTAIAQGAMNMVNQVGPDGSLTYDKIGEDTFTDSLTGKTYNVPKYQATTALSPAGQRLQGMNEQAQQNLAQISVDQSAKIGGILGTNVNLSNDAVESRLLDLGSKRLDPQFQKDEDALRTRLANSGVQAGSAAWNDEFGRLTQAQNDARNQLLLSGRGQAVQEILTERNQPLNEISALMSGSQVSQPSFVNTPQTQLANTDYQGAVYNSYAGQMDAYKQKVASSNAMMGGLFGLAGSLAGAGAYAYKSDRRLKKDIERVGTLDNGLPTYAFRYHGDDKLYFGVMSDDVREHRPDAIKQTPDGFDMVDYARAAA